MEGHLHTHTNLYSHCTYMCMGVACLSPAEGTLFLAMSAIFSPKPLDPMKVGRRFFKDVGY